jgi:23S rRNA maturation mini-RNase III
MGDEITYRVMKMVHDKDQAEEGKHLTPHYWEKGERIVCRGMSKEQAEEYRDKLQRLSDTSTRPFIFTTYSIEKEYPEKVV